MQLLLPSFKNKNNCLTSTCAFTVGAMTANLNSFFPLLSLLYGSLVISLSSLGTVNPCVPLARLPDP